MPFGSPLGPGYRPDPSAANNDPKSNLVNLGQGKLPNPREYAAPIQALSREAEALLAVGKNEEASQKYNTAARMCAKAAELFEDPTRGAMLDARQTLLARAKTALNHAVAHGPRANPGPERSSSLPALPPPPAKEPLPVANGLTEALSTYVKEPDSTFAYDNSDFKSSVKYVGDLVKQAEEIKKTNPQAAVKMFTEVAELLEWWGVKRRFDNLVTGRQLRQDAKKYALEAERLRNGTTPVVAATTANGAGNTDLAEIERRARDCIVNDSPDKAVTWDDVIGCEAAKNALLARLIDPYVVVQSADRKKGTGVLLYGPSGTGKTMLVKAVVNLVQELRSEQVPEASESGEASESAAAPAGEASEAKPAPKNGITLIMASMADVNSKWVGEGEKFVRALFDTARKESPSVIFIDEVDALFAQRTADQNQAGRAVLNEFLIQSNDLNKGGADVTLLAATNLPWLLDDAIRRRVSAEVAVSLPDPASRAIILKQKIKKLNYPCSATDAEVEALAKSAKMNNFSGSNLEAVAQRAMECGALRRRHESRFFVERDGIMWPCPEGTPGCKSGTFLDLLRDHRRKHMPGKLSMGEEPITAADLEEACKHVPTPDSQIAQFEAYRKKVQAARQ